MASGYLDLILNNIITFPIHGKILKLNQFYQNFKTSSKNHNRISKNYICLLFKQMLLAKELQLPSFEMYDNKVLNIIILLIH